MYVAMKRLLVVFAVSLLVSDSSEASSTGSGSVEIWGTWLFDFDTGITPAPFAEADIHWNQLTLTERRLDPWSRSGAELVALGMIDFSNVREADLLGYAYSLTPIQGPPAGSLLDVGSVFAVRTSAGNYAKAEVMEYSQGGSNGSVDFYDLHIRYEVFDGVVPEPNSLAMIGLALACLSLYVSRGRTLGVSTQRYVMERILD